jgi:hypothetical protein
MSGVLGRIGRDWRALSSEQRLAAVAAILLLLSMLLPWYQETGNAIVSGKLERIDDSKSAFGVYSFVEAAIFVVVVGTIALLWARAERKAFHLPGGDGAAITLAGGWALLLLVWRLFDKPDVNDPGATVGIQWGIFVALLAAGALLATGARVRAVHRPEPPNPVAEEEPPPYRPRPPRRRTDSTAVTDVLGERPDWSGEPPEAPGRARPARPDDPSEEPTREDRLF